MNSDKLAHLIANPNAVSKDETDALETVLHAFPYFQMARVLHLKGLKNQHSFKYNKALKMTAAHTTNRTVLFDFITTNSLDFEAEINNDKETLSAIDVVDSKVITHLQKSITVSEENKIQTTVVNKHTDDVLKNKEVLKIGKPINFNKNDSFSFNEWLQLKPVTSIKRVEKAEKVKNESVIVAKAKVVLLNEEKNNSIEKSDLIAKFIENKPKIKPLKGHVITGVPDDSTIANNSLMTETLARVYLEQKKYKNAIAAFKILSLKYPEKSSFFADRIKAIKFLEKHKS